MPTVTEGKKRATYKKRDKLLLQAAEIPRTPRLPTIPSLTTKAVKRTTTKANQGKTPDKRTESMKLIFGDEIKSAISVSKSAHTEQS